MSVVAAPPQTFPTTDGRNIDVFPVVSELTVAQAAKLVDKSEACINSWLNLGRIPFRQEHGERLIPLEDLLEFERDWDRRLASFAEMVSVNQEMGLYDD
jgi:hypothetical protein